MSIYTQYRDPKITRWLTQREDQLSSIDLSEVSKNFEKLGHLDQRALKFSYKTPLETIEKDFKDNKSEFY